MAIGLVNASISITTNSPCSRRALTPSSRCSQWRSNRADFCLPPFVFQLSSTAVSAGPSRSLALARNLDEALAGAGKSANRFLIRDVAAAPLTVSITSPTRSPARCGAESRSTWTTVGSPSTSATARPTLKKRGRHQSNFSSGAKTRVCGSSSEAIIRRRTAYNSWLEPASAASERKAVL